MLIMGENSVNCGGSFSDSLPKSLNQQGSVAISNNNSPSAVNQNPVPVSLSPPNLSGLQSATMSHQSNADYLSGLMKDRKQLSAFPNVFVHLERLIDDGN